MSAAVGLARRAWRSAALALVVGSFAAAAQARYNDDDRACSYSNTTVALETRQGQQVQIYGGTASCRRANSGLDGLLFLSEYHDLSYDGTYNEVTRVATEVIRSDGFQYSATGRCPINPWINVEATSAKGFRLVPACQNVNFTSKFQFGTADRFPFMARFGGVPWSGRLAQLEELWAAQKLKESTPDGAPVFAPESVAAHIYVYSKRKAGSLQFLLPAIEARRWIDRFEVEVAFTLHQKGQSLPWVNWLPDGSMPGPAMPITSQTDQQQYYDAKKKDFYDDTSYAFRVCAVNAAGRTCSAPVVAAVEAQRETFARGPDVNGNGVTDARSAKVATSNANANGAVAAPNWGGSATSRTAAPGSALGGAGPQWGGLPTTQSATALTDAERAAKRQRDRDGQTVPPETPGTPPAGTPGATPPTTPPATPPATPQPCAAGWTGPGCEPPQSTGGTPGASRTTAVAMTNAAGRGATAPNPLPLKPNLPTDVSPRAIDREPNFVEVTWRVPANDGRQRIDRFRVLACPQAGGELFCGGDVNVASSAGESFKAGTVVSARVGLMVNWKGTPNPVHGVYVCAENSAGLSCIKDMVPVQFWQPPGAAGMVQRKP
jgi:hypothetical protein